MADNLDQMSNKKIRNCTFCRTQLNITEKYYFNDNSCPHYTFVVSDGKENELTHICGKMECVEKAKQKIETTISKCTICFKKISKEQIITDNCDDIPYYKYVSTYMTPTKNENIEAANYMFIVVCSKDCLNKSMKNIDELNPKIKLEKICSICENISPTCILCPKCGTKHVCEKCNHEC
jgi:hypothetical protein